MTSYSLRIFLVAAISISFASLGSARPEVLEDLSGFDRPVATVFAPDGKALFVVNRSRGEVGARRGAGSITKMSVNADLQFKVASRRFVVGLTAPSDIDFLPVELEGVAPKGSLILVSGTPLIESEDGRMEKNASDDLIGFTLFDPLTGKTLAKADFSPEADLRFNGEHPLISPNSMSFDRSGNLYIADTGIGGNLFRNRLKAQPVIYRISVSGMQQMFSGESPSRVDVMKISSIPGDISYHPQEDAVYFLANHLQGASRGSVFKVSSRNFTEVMKIETVVRELTSLASMIISPNGRTLIASAKGELLIPRNRKSARLVRFKPEMTYSTPGKFDYLPLSGGDYILAMPEETGDAGAGKGQRVRITRLDSRN
jgi:hypothetical protein